MGPAGRFDKRITFQTQASGVDSRGINNGAWSNYKSCYAEVVPVASSETDKARQKHETAAMVFRIRTPQHWTPNAKMRITYKSRTYEIGSISEDPLEPHETLVTGTALV